MTFKYRKVLYIILLTFLLSFLIQVRAATLRLSADDFSISQEKLDAEEILVKSLATDICFELEFYDTKESYNNKNKASSFTLSKCEENFLKSEEKIKAPKVHLKCQYQSNVLYKIQPHQDPDAMTLVVLTPHNITLTYLPYDLVEKTRNGSSSLQFQVPGHYTTWTTLLSKDGSHSPWRRGPDLRPWNMTGEVRQRNYDVRIKLDHGVVGRSSAVNAFFTWKSFDDEDICFDFVHQCDGNITTNIKISSNERHRGHSRAVSALPLGASCELLLTGKYGLTRFKYRTPDCNELNACIEYEMAQNISMEAVPGAAGWDVLVRWALHHEPLSYNVTLITENVTRSVELPGNVTEAIFADVDDSGIYIVAIGSVLTDRTVWTSNRALFPAESLRWGALGAALGGAWGALGCASVLLAVLVFLWRRRRRTKTSHVYCPQEPEEKPPKEECDCDGGDLEASGAEDSWELRSERLLLHEVVGEGAFGVVRRGTLAPTGKEVAVKMLKDFPTLDEIRSFRSEMELMKSVGAHPHIVSLVGCCSSRRPFIVAEYCSRGDLLSFLRCSWDVMISKRNAKYYNNNIETTDYRNDLFKCKMQGEHSKLVVNKLYDLQGICDTDLTSRDLLSFCRQIAMGMEFLASNRLVHRDLAARNVLVTSDRTLKIADFGLSRDVYEENQYKQTGNGKMPMKWMALESLTQRIYTSQSDVWSFGVVMWEVASVGGSPYAGVPPARLPRLLRAGYRMPRPANCSKQLYEVMLSCWRSAPRARPTFPELHARLDELLHRAVASDYLALTLDAADPPPGLSATHYVRMILRDKLGWSRGDSYSRSRRSRTAQSNHYSSPPASTLKAQSVS